jgi:hypothetical protein
MRVPNVRKATTKFVMCAFASAQNNSEFTERIFIFDIPVLFENLSRNLKFLWKVVRIQAALNENVCTFMISLAELFLDWEMFQTGFVEIKTRIINSLIGKSFLLWDNVRKYIKGNRAGRTQMTNTCLMGQIDFAYRIITAKMKTHPHGR